MKSSGRIIIGAALLALIVVAGFLAGYYTNQNQNIAKNNLAPYKPQKPNNRVYDMSPPSIGSDVETYDLPDLRFNEGLYFKRLPANEAATIPKGTKVLVYNKQGKVLDALAEVTSVGENVGDTDEKKTIVIAFNQPGIVAEEQVASGKLILSRTSALPRLPIKAIVENDQKQAFVWQVAGQEDGTYVAYLKPVKIVAIRNDYAGIEAPASYTNMYITNPDEFLEDGKSVRVQLKTFVGPPQTDDQRIQAMLDQVMRERNLQAELNRDRAGQLNKLAGGCGVPQDAAKQFMDRIKAASGSSTALPPAMSMPLGAQ